MIQILIAKCGELTASIGKIRNGSVNIILNFNPIPKHNFTDLIQDSPLVVNVSHIARYDDSLGGMALNIISTATEENLLTLLEETLPKLLN